MNLEQSALPYPPPTINILLLTDGRAGYGTQNFSLSLLYKALCEPVSPYVNLEVRKAHRNKSNPDHHVIRVVKFTDEILELYDEVWLFGVIADSVSYLELSELKSLSKFMDGGHGVFATGDHALIGAPLCGAIPRVQSMRKWFKGSPPGGTALRHDSLVRDDRYIYKSTNQQDDIPQVIFPTTYMSPNPLTRKAYPHPLLNGPKGPIRFLPGHLHEGECCVPSNLKQEFCFDGYTIIEYPPGQGIRLAPEIVAKAGLVEPHVTYEYFTCHPLTEVETFNLIAAYDGHQISIATGDCRQNIGRVVVDSSFHHFFDINLRKFDQSPDFTSRDRGQTAYHEIKTYFRNIALWLAPRAKQRAMRNYTLWALRWSSPLVEDLLTMMSQISYNELEAVDWHLPLKLGTVTRETLADHTSVYLPLQWALDLIRDLPQADFPGRDAFIACTDPWRGRSTDTESTPGFDVETVAEAVLGGVILTLAVCFRDQEDRIESRDREFNDALNRGVKMGLKSLLESLDDKAGTFADAAQALRAALR